MDNLSGSLRLPPKPVVEDDEQSQRTIQNHDAFQRGNSYQSFLPSAQSKWNKVSGSRLYRPSGSGMSSIGRDNLPLRQSSGRRLRCYKKRKTVLYDFGDKKLVLERRGTPVKTDAGYYPTKYHRRHRENSMSSIKRSQSSDERKGHLLNRVVGGTLHHAAKSKKVTTHKPKATSPAEKEDSFDTDGKNEDSFKT